MTNDQLVIRTSSLIRYSGFVIRHLFLLIALGGCAQQQHPGAPADVFESTGGDEVGATHFAVTSVTPFQQVQADLQPNFQIDEQTAIQDVIPAAMRSSQARSQVSRLQVGVGMFDPIDRDYDRNSGGGRGGRSGRGGSSDENDNAPSDGPSRGGRGERGGGRGSQEGDQSGPSEARSFRGGSGGRGGDRSDGNSSNDRDSYRRDPNLGERDVIPLPDDRASVDSRLNAALPSGEGLDVEAQLKYTLATSLIQYVRLTNRYVRDMVQLQDHDAYVVRVQIGLMPLSREAQYDTYVDVAFFMGDTSSPSTPRVVPLLATDSLEGLLQARSNAEVKDLAFQLRALVQTVGGGVDAQRLVQQLDAVSGQDLNSLLTVGRASDNVLRVRLGAAAQPSGRFVMLPRTYTVPVVLLVPRSQQPRSSSQISAVSKTVFVNALTGKVRRSRLRWNDLGNLEPIRGTYELFEYKDKVYDLTECARTNDYAKFVKIIKEADGKESNVERLGKLWLEALSLRATEAIQTVTFPLPAKDIGAPPPPQTAVLYDDGKGAIASLHGGRDLDRMSLQAVLEIAAPNGNTVSAIKLRAASEAARSADQRDVQFHFASPGAAGLELGTGEAASRRLMLRVFTSDSTSKDVELIYPVLYVPVDR